jgi:hypothetical protein
MLPTFRSLTAERTISIHDSSDRDMIHIMDLSLQQLIMRMKFNGRFYLEPLGSSHLYNLPEHQAKIKAYWNLRNQANRRA